MSARGAGAGGCWDAAFGRPGATLCGHPRLAGEARCAAGQVAHVARRPPRGEPLPPFIGNIDLAELLPAARDGAPARPRT